MNAENYPDISFIENTTADDVLTQMINDYNEMYEAETGKQASLAKGSRTRLILMAAALQLFQTMQYVDFSGKMGLLTYSYGDYLDNLASLRGTERKGEEPAVTTLRFSIAEALSSPVAIPAGCRATNGNGIYFATDEYAEITAGDTYVDVKATCTEAGLKGNGLVAGEVGTLVNTLPYVTSVANTVESYGGSDRETDNELKERIYNIGKAYSTAGPIDAYVYQTKEAMRGIGDVKVSSPSAGNVSIVFIKEDGTVPSSSEIQTVSDYLSSKNIRPLTDNVSVSAPTTTAFNIDITYYISNSDSSSVGTIQSNVADAVNKYKAWQTEKIGRDINPDYLRMLVMEAGAKRVTINSPSYTAINNDVLPAAGTVTVTYGGIESD